MALDKVKIGVLDGTSTGVFENYHKVPVYANDAARDHNTTGIPSPAVGMIIYNTAKGVLQQYNSQGWSSIASPPTISSIDYPGSTTALDITGEFTDATCDYNNDPTITHDARTNLKVGMSVKGTGIPTGATIASITSNTSFELSASTTGGAVTNGTLTFNSEVLVITGTNFQTGVTVTIDNSAPSIVTRNSTTQITITGMPAKSAGTYTDGLKVSNPSGLSATFNVDYSATPSWTTASGNVGSAMVGATISEVDLVATSNSAVTYAITSGALPGGLSMATSDGDITGTLTASAATYNFTVTATDAEAQSTPRAFNYIVAAHPTFSGTSGVTTTTGGYKYYYWLLAHTGGDLVVPSDISVEILLIGAGASGGSGTGGGGGAGGLIYISAFTMTAGTYSVTVGAGGARTTAGVGESGGNSVISLDGGSNILTATGGGYGGGYNGSLTPAYVTGASGGSAGGTHANNSGFNGQTAVTATSPFSGSGGNITTGGTTYSNVAFGNSGGKQAGSAAQHGGGGGGGAGGVGGDGATYNSAASVGGNGKDIAAFNHTVWGGSSDDTYAAGGGGANYRQASGQASNIGGSTLSNEGSDAPNAGTTGGATQNTGSGGGATWNHGQGKGGTGANGIVILRFAA